MLNINFPVNVKINASKAYFLTATLLSSNHIANNSFPIFFMTFYRENFDEELLPEHVNHVISKR